MVINMVFGQEEYELGLLGRQGENIETVLRIDCTSVLEECPGATIGVRWKDNVPGEEYYDLAVTKAEDGIYEAKLTTMDLRYAGNKDIVVRVIEGEWEKRSCTFMGYVAKSLFDFRPPAGPVSDYLSRLMKALTKAEDIQKHGPVIGENGHWYIFDGGAYVDTGVKAEGRDGEDGYSPTLTAERVENGVKLTVTNKESTREVWVYDGEKGDNATDEQIRAAVDAYMQDNPLEAPTVDLDTTLSETGKAADAGAVGDALAALEEKIPASGGLNTTAQNLLLTILSNGVYSTDQSQNIDALEDALASGGSGGTGGGEVTPTLYTITSNLTNVTTSNSGTTVTAGESYSATLTAADGYVLDTVTVLMGGVDVTESAYAEGIVHIAAVTGNVVITASAVEESTGENNGWTAGVPYTIEWTDGYEADNSSNGGLKESANYSCSDYIPCLGVSGMVGDANVSGGYLFAYDADYTYLGRITFNASYPSCINRQVAYVRVNCKTANKEALVLTPMVYDELTATTAWEADKYYTVPFYAEGMSLNYNTGAETTDATYWASDYALCYGATTVTVTNLPYTTWRKTVCFYDADKNFVSGVIGEANAHTVPENASYFRVSGMNGFEYTIQKPNRPWVTLA